jgi:hypothetical protein
VSILKVNKFRDLTLMHINEETMMVLACDSCGGIGMKKHDALETPQEVVGYLTAGVALSELLAFRAKPITIVNNFCVEMNPTGEKIIGGIKKAITDCGLDQEMLLTGSTEENMPTVQTSIGITAIGMIDLKNWTKPKTYKGDDLIVVGKPKVGSEVLKSKEIPNIKIISLIKDILGINEILPVGSKGIDYEIGELCKSNDLDFKYTQTVEVDIKKSAGPVTCFIISGQKETILEQLTKYNVSYSYLGCCIEKC